MKNLKNPEIISAIALMVSAALLVWFNVELAAETLSITVKTIAGTAWGVAQWSLGSVQLYRAYVKAALKEVEESE